MKNKKIEEKIEKGGQLSGEMITVKTEVKYLPISPRKLRLIVAAIKKLSPKEAIRKLSFLNKKGSVFIIKAIKTVLADAEHNFKLDKESLVFDQMIVNQGPVLKRRDNHHGARFNGGLIKKPKSHLLIKVVGRKNLV